MPTSLCAGRVPHPPHEWADDRDMDDAVWCRGRMPFTIEAARAGAELVTSLRQVAAWEEMCGKTPSGRQFLMSQDWRLRVVRLRADSEMAKAAERVKPWWRRLFSR